MERNTIEKHATHWGAWLASDFPRDGVSDNDWDELLIQLCGHCGHRAQAFHSGWNGSADGFGEYYCPNCKSVCFNDSIPVVLEPLASEWDRIDVRDYCRARAHIDFWHGYLVDKNSVNNPVAFQTGTDAGQALFRRVGMIQAVEWNPFCPVCEAPALSDIQFNFHHWDYKTDRGVQICEQCHEYIHRDLTATQQSQQAGVVDWKIDAVERMIDKAAGEGVIAENPILRFNIPKAILSAAEPSTPIRI